MLAHGGTAGAVAEGAFIVIPIVVFAVLARVSRRRREAEAAAAEGVAQPDDDQGSGEP